jgi:hypothetical protein
MYNKSFNKRSTGSVQCEGEVQSVVYCQKKGREGKEGKERKGKERKVKVKKKKNEKMKK